MQDETVPVNDAKELHSWNSNSHLILIEEANHTFNTEHPFTSNGLPEPFEKVLAETFQFLK